MLATLKADYLEARKQRDTVMTKLLSTFINDAEMIGKNDGGREVTESEIVALLKKYIKNLTETLEVSGDETTRIEIGLLQTYLPTQLSEDEISRILLDQIEENGFDSPKQMGQLMKFLKENYDGQFDGKRASQLARELLGG